MVVGCTWAGAGCRAEEGSSLILRRVDQGVAFGLRVNEDKLNRGRRGKTREGNGFARTPEWVT